MTELGASAPLHDVTVEAGDWMTALTRARTHIGERGGVPPGASCAVAPDGKVTILDGVARRQYALVTTTAPLSGPPAAAPAAPGPAPAKKLSKATVAYLPSPFASPRLPGAAAAPAAGAPTAVAPAAPGPVVPKPASFAPPAPVSSAPSAAKPPSFAPPAPVSSAPAPVKPASFTPPAAAPSAASAPAPAPSKTKVPKHTVAYLPGAAATSEPAPTTPASAPAPAPASASASAPASASASASASAPAPASTPASTPAAAPAPAPTTAAAPASVPAPAFATAPAPASVPAPASEPAPAPASVPAPAPASGPDDGAELLYSRDAEPSADSPLAYRERTFVVAAGTSADDAEQIVRRRFAALREELADRPKGKLVNMAVFDHRWEGRPARPPLVALQWKDWKGEPEIQRPSGTSHAPPAASAPPPAASSPPVASARPSAPAPASPPPRPRSVTPAHDERLASAFESLQDLFFLGSPLEGADFVLNVLADLVPHEASSVCLYDINSDELRFVALRGPGAEERKGEAVPLGIGLIGAAAADFARPMLIEEVARDGRFDPGVDGRVGLDATTMALVPVFHSGRLQAVLQLVNRQGQAQFSKADSNLLAYVGEKLGEFLQQSRLSEPSRPQAPKGTRTR